MYVTSALSLELMKISRLTSPRTWGTSASSDVDLSSRSFVSSRRRRRSVDQNDADVSSIYLRWKRVWDAESSLARWPRLSKDSTSWSAKGSHRRSRSPCSREDSTCATDYGQKVHTPQKQRLCDALNHNSPRFIRTTSIDSNKANCGTLKDCLCSKPEILTTSIPCREALRNPQFSTGGSASNFSSFVSFLPIICFVESLAQWFDEIGILLLICPMDFVSFQAK